MNFKGEKGERRSKRRGVSERIGEIMDPRKLMEKRIKRNKKKGEI